jgi:hypothetical protein
MEFDCLDHAPAVDALDQVSWRGPGRPFIPTAKGPLAPFIAKASIPQYIMEKLHLVAQEEFCSVSQIMRMVLLHELRRRGVDTKPPKPGKAADVSDLT